jgi:co-chaperonin GroES (HSP10)
MSDKVIPKKVTRCFMDVVLLKPLNMGDFVSKGGIIKPTDIEDPEMKLAMGQVVLVGPGTMSLPLGKNIPNEIEEGMTVFFHEKCGWPVLLNGTETLRAVRETDILMEIDIADVTAPAPQQKRAFYKED